MIRLRDGLSLAYTKLKVHKIRTGLVVAIAGLLFGGIVFLVLVSQGIFNSVDSFSREGLNNRTFAIVSPTQANEFNVYDHSSDQDFIKQVEAEYTARVERKKQAAKKYNVDYNPQFQDISPITIDSETKQKIINEGSYQSPDVMSVVNKNRQAAPTFEINKYLKPYQSAKVVQTVRSLYPADGNLNYIKEGKEKIASTESEKMEAMYGNDSPNLQILNKSITETFVSDTSKLQTGEIPVILPFSNAEKLLGLKPLEASAKYDEQLARLKEVRNRVGDITASFCYRNNASEQLLSEASSQEQEIKNDSKEPGYVAPSIIYKTPAKDSCAGVETIKDTRTTFEKQQYNNMVNYEKEVGEYIGEPAQQKITVRGVGISGDSFNMSGAWSIANMVKELLNSSLGYNTWTIPEDLLQQIPAEYKPASVFDVNAKKPTFGAMSFSMPDTYLVEFSNQDEARMALKKNFGDDNQKAYLTPFGSSVLIVNEAKEWVGVALRWVLLVLGIIAAIILASIIGRTISEGRRESAVFRAIGASRKDIGSIYGLYTLMLCLRVIIFALVSGVVFALIVDLLVSKQATVGARLAYAASESSEEFHLIGFNSPYLLWIAITIVVAGLISSILPIILGARRNPINDMRNDT